MWWLLVLAACNVDGPTDSGPADTDTVEDGEWDIRLSVVERPRDAVEEGEVVTIVVNAIGERPPATLQVTSDQDGLLATYEVDPQNPRVTFESTALTPGVHQLSFIARLGELVTTEVVEVAICRQVELEDFSTDPTGETWTAYGDATWNAEGYLQITNIDQSQGGHLFKTDRRYDAGDFRMTFDVATGGGINSGADGLAVSLWDVEDVTALEGLLATRSNGGCLGYGCDDTNVSGFHIEFDTWENDYDPTAANHVAVHFDGDAENPVQWVSVPNLEDLAWRAMEVQIVGERIIVLIDGSRVIDEIVPGYAFKGGYLGVSASTGWASNYHRIDNLDLDVCEVP